MKVKIKKLHPDAVIPKYAKPGDAGLDLVAIDYSETSRYKEYKTGLAIEIPEGYVGLIFPRSSISKTELILRNCVGVIDSGYRGEICLRFLTVSAPFMEVESTYDIGDKVGQLIILPYPQIEFEEVDELSSTDRGEGGFGSTGK